jgi:hypothetical protein
MGNATIKKTSPALIAVTWLIVLVPTAWGLTYTVQNALKIFSKASPPAASGRSSTAPAK